jgi:hypothetical protein
MQIQSAIQSPIFLAELYLPTGTLLLSSGDPVKWNSKLYLQSGMKVSNIAQGEGGIKQAQIIISNNQFTWSSVFLSSSPSGSRVIVYKLLGSAPYAIGDAYMVFDGVIQDMPDMVQFVTLNCETANARSVTIPNITIGPPYFNFMPAAGQQFTWGNQVFTLDPR